MPRRKLTEPSEEYKARLDAWKQQREDDQAFLRTHKTSPVVRRALASVRSSADYRALLRGEHEPQGRDYGESWSGEDFRRYRFRKRRYWAQVQNARQWLGDPE